MIKQRHFKLKSFLKNGCDVRQGGRRESLAFPPWTESDNLLQ